MWYASILSAVLAVQPPVSGSQTATATLSVSIAAQARLSLTSNAIVFPNADPDHVPEVPGSPEITVLTKARTSANAQVALTIQASDDLRSGISTLPASLIAWTGSGDGFVPGVLSRTAAQLAATWTGSGTRTGTQRFTFRNSWTHPPGTYSVTLIYTVSMP